MHAMRSDPPRPKADRRPRTFLCRDDLYRDFEARARELQCSVDWLLAEAMKRLLASPTLARQASLPPPPPRSTPFVPPPPPPVRKATGSFVGARNDESLALRVGDTRTALDRPRLIIGRSARDAQVVVRDASVSRQHAMVERAVDGWYIVDMGSTNGVLLNGTRIARARIRAGDVLVVGPVSIAVERA